MNTCGSYKVFNTFGLDILNRFSILQTEGAAETILFCSASTQNLKVLSFVPATLNLQGFILIIAEQNFDAWGRKRNPANWTYTGVPATPDWLYRGFTGHEHVAAFNLINMNGRMYDPMTGLMMSPDNYVPMPFNPGGYNRYLYANGNPLKFVDPDGEFFLGTIFTFVVDLFKTAFIDGGLDPTSKNARLKAWEKFDPTAPWSATNKAFKIDIGQFKTDPNRSIAGRAFQLLSRFTWEAPQTILGNAYSHLRNLVGNVAEVTYYRGVTLVNRIDNSNIASGLTLGSYINSRNLIADPSKDQIFRHEFGHTLQSQLIGPLYLTHVGIPSLIGQWLDDNGLNDHNREWYETQANRMAERYLKKHEPNALTILPWDDNRYPRRYNPNWYWIVAHPPLAFMWWLFF